MADTRPIRNLKMVTFPEASMHEERVAAVLVTKDEHGAYHAYTKDIPGRAQPDPELIAMLVQGIEIQEL